MIVQDVVEPNRIYSPDKMAELKRKHGISKYLDQAIEAHPLVKQALMNAAQIDQVVLGNDRTQNSMDVHDLKTILATREDGSMKPACVSTTKDGRIYKYNIAVSRHSGKIGVRTDDLDAVRGISPKFLKRGVDPDAVKALQQEIDGFRSALQQLIPTVEEKDREYQALMVSICSRVLAILLYCNMSSPSLTHFLPTVPRVLPPRRKRPRIFRSAARISRPKSRISTLWKRRSKLLIARSERPRMKSLTLTVNPKRRVSSKN